MSALASAAPIIVIGAGQAGLQICESLRRGGYGGRLLLIGDEPEPPYQRPPLSKAFLLGETERARLAFRPADFYAKQAIELRLAAQVTAIHRATREVELATGERLAYAKLALATGTRVRRVHCPGAEQAPLHYLRDVADAERLRRDLEAARTVVVIGGGFIGLEVAAIARKRGAEVVVLEALERLMARAVAPPVSEFYAALHRSQGVAVELGVGVASFDCGAQGCAVVTTGGQRYVADVVVVGIGVVPNSELAEHAGLACRNGIVVDVAARTSDPDIVAAGDCTQHMNGFLAREIRLESVQNAADQAKVAAATLLGQDAAYHQVPWFWSDQYDVKLQIAGIGMPYDACVVRGERTSRAFSVLYFRAGRLVGADSINRPAEHMAVRKLLARGASLDAAAAATIDLVQLARGLTDT